MSQAQSTTEANDPTSGASRGSLGLVERLWLVLSSERTTSILVILLAGVVAITAFVPQGREALEIAESADAAALHQLAAWGLTELFTSQWIRALGVLLAANLVAVAITSALGGKGRELARAPDNAPLKAELTAALPERAVEALRENFRARLGAPAAEGVEGSRVTMMFETSPLGRVAPMLSHVGLMLLIVGAGVLSMPLPEGRSAVRAFLEVKDRSSGFVGTFDMMSGEQLQFFRFPAKYVVRDYVASKGGLGPAVRIERRGEGRGGVEDFWIYEKAPVGFDERHRGGEVAIRALDLGLAPLPGSGVTASPASVLLLAGLGLLLAGVLGARRPEGRIWLEADGDVVRIVGVPRTRDDRTFFVRFESLGEARGRHPRRRLSGHGRGDRSASPRSALSLLLGRGVASRRGPTRCARSGCRASTRSRSRRRSRPGCR